MRSAASCFDSDGEWEGVSTLCEFWVFGVLEDASGDDGHGHIASVSS